MRADKTSQDVPRWVRVNQTLLTAAILNLAINARNAVPNGGELTFDIDDVVLDHGGAKAFAPLPPGSYVRIALADTGSGIPADIQAKVFESFFSTKGPAIGAQHGLRFRAVVGWPNRHRERQGTGHDRDALFSSRQRAFHVGASPLGDCSSRKQPE